MKTPRNLLITSALILISGIAASSQQSLNETAPAPSLDNPPVLALDRATWDVYDPYNRGFDFSAVNTPEARYQRWKTILGFEYREEYARQFPRSQEEIAASNEAAYQFEHPQSFQDFLNEPRSAEDQQALEQRLDAMLHPKIVQ